jgi:hypothetical protein
MKRVAHPWEPSRARSTPPSTRLPAAHPAAPACCIAPRHDPGNSSTRSPFWLSHCLRSELPYPPRRVNCPHCNESLRRFVSIRYGMGVRWAASVPMATCRHVDHARRRPVLRECKLRTSRERSPPMHSSPEGVRAGRCAGALWLRARAWWRPSGRTTGWPLRRRARCTAARRHPPTAGATCYLTPSSLLAPVPAPVIAMVQPLRSLPVCCTRITPPGASSASHHSVLPPAEPNLTRLTA